MRNKDRRFDFIDQKLWDNLSKRDREVLNSYRGTYGNLRKCENKIEKYEQKISDLKDQINSYHQTLSDKNHLIDHLRNTFCFTISIVVSNKHYFNISISRTGNSPKSGSLGREEVIVNHLLKYYKGRRSKLKEIKSDWKGFLCSDKELYDRIQLMIIKNPDKFYNTTINRDVLFPLNTKKSNK